MTVKVRFAPSPTGRLHVGNARAALVNWLFARKHGGIFLLRFDDTDPERCREEFVEAIRADLAWLGLDWDESFRQSGRVEAYRAAFERLKQAGRLYPCFESPEELSAKRRARLQRGEPPIYDRAALNMTEAERQARLDAGYKPHWRFKLEDRPVEWDDLIRGPVRFEGGHLSDPVLFRADGGPTYTLASVLDDGDSAVTHIIRGEDHVTNTAAQVQLFEALGFSAPTFAHLSLLTDAGGGGLSKRIGSLALAELREQGIEPMALVSLLARLGTAEAVEPETDMADVVEGFDLGRFGRAPAKFNPDDLRLLNAKVLQRLPFTKVADRLASLGVEGEAAADFWAAVQGNIDRLDEAADWWRVCTAPVTPVIEDAAFAATAAELLPSAPWDEGTWGAWTKSVKAETGAKGRALFMPLRLALTGRDHGPELKKLLPIIGPERARARLEGRTA